MMQLVIPKPSEDDEESKRITSQQSQESHQEQQHRRTHSNGSDGSVIITAATKGGCDQGESAQTGEKDGSSSTVTLVEDDVNDEVEDVGENHSVGDTHSLSFETENKDHMESDHEEEEEEEEKQEEAEHPEDEEVWRRSPVHRTTAATLATPLPHNNSWSMLPRIEPQPVGHSPYRQAGTYYPQQYHHYHQHNYGTTMMNPPFATYRSDPWSTNWPTNEAGDGQPHMMPMPASPSPAPRPQTWGGGNATWPQQHHDMDVYGLASPMPPTTTRPVLHSFPNDGRESHDVPIPHPTTFFRHNKQDSSSMVTRNHNFHPVPHSVTPHLLSPHFSSPSPTPPRIHERRKSFADSSRRYHDSFRFPANNSEGEHTLPMDFDDEEEEGPSDSKTPKKTRIDASRKTASTTASSSSPRAAPTVHHSSSTTATSSDDEKVSANDSPKVDTAKTKSERSSPPSTSASIRKADINRNDVLCGRGAGTNRHWGNHWFRQLVAQNQPAYAAAGVVQRCNIAAEIVKAIRTADPPGRFLKRKDESAKGSDDDENVVFFDIGDEAARAKTSQALREKGSDRKRPSAMDPEDVEVTRNKKKKKSAGLDDDAATLLARFAAPGALSPLVSPSHTPSPPSMTSYSSYGHEHGGRGQEPNAPHVVGSPAFYPLTGNESATSLFGTTVSSPQSASASAKLRNESVMDDLSIPQLSEGTDTKEGKSSAKKSSRPGSPTVVDSTEIHDHDVLFGRGGVTNSHAGNRRFRQLVESHQASYLLAPKRQKATIARSIVEAIHALRPCGRFLMPNSNGPGGKGNSWVEVSDERAREKTSQALREKAPEMRRVYWAAKSLVAGAQRGAHPHAGGPSSKSFGGPKEVDGMSSPPPPAEATGMTEGISPVGGSSIPMSSYQTSPYHHQQPVNPMYGMGEQHPPVAPWGAPPVTGHRASPPMAGYSHSHAHPHQQTYHPQDHHHHHHHHHHQHYSEEGSPHSAASSPSSSPPPSEAQPRRSSVEIVTEIGPNDVLCGRGAGVNGHDGNRRFRELVNQYRPRYADSPKMEKATVAADIVNFIRSLNPPGRFLMRVEDGSPPGSRSGPERWVDVGDERAREKTSQALREKAR